MPSTTPTPGPAAPGPVWLRALLAAALAGVPFAYSGSLVTVGCSGAAGDYSCDGCISGAFGAVAQRPLGFLVFGVVLLCVAYVLVTLGLSTGRSALG